MAADSLLGGGTDLSTAVDTRSEDLINMFLTDTVATSAIRADVGGSQLLVGSGHNGEKQGVLLPAAGSVTGSIDDGVLKMTISVPANAGFAFEGKDNVTPDTVGQFLSGVIDAYLPDTAENAAMRGSISTAVSDIQSQLTAGGVTDVVVRMVDFVGGAETATSGDIKFDATATSGAKVFAFNLASLAAGQTVVVEGVDASVLVGNGSVRVDGTAGAVIVSDFGDQSVIGGAGGDTLVGGGGNDTLTGGAGDDVFSFARGGSYEIGDFAGSGDKINFNVDGVTTVEQLLTLITDIKESDAGVTYEFGAHGSITLVGLSAADVTADMVDFFGA